MNSRNTATPQSNHFFEFLRDYVLGVSSVNPCVERVGEAMWKIKGRESIGFFTRTEKNYPKNDLDVTLLWMENSRKNDNSNWFCETVCELVCETRVKKVYEFIMKSHSHTGFIFYVAHLLLILIYFPNSLWNWYLFP